jgi:protein involved in polysaccharide export with SLBB domain
MTRTLIAALVAEIRAIVTQWPGWLALRSRAEARGRGRAVFSAHWVLLAIGLSVSGCAGSSALGPAAQADYTASIEAAAVSPRIQAGEKIRLTVYGEASLSGDYQIDPSGFVSLPLAGTVKAEGLTQSELERELAKKFRSEYLRNPKVTVSVVEFRPFYILGEIQKPGAYPYSSGLNVLRAIAVAGGTTYRGSKSTVEIQHAGESEMREYSLAPSIPVLPGDIIRIPQRYF